jgi:O-acetyl-ADP-ribose deacetylase (regulator of RNase III)
MATITEICGNIFESSCQTIVNTVNCVGVMGKGIAFEYRHRFPEMYLAYARMCAQAQLRPGLLHLWTKSTPWILNFPTKNDWKFPSKPKYIEDGLIKFADTYMAKGVTSIAFPELGTSSGGLEWRDVRILMYEYLEPLPNLDIEIYHFDPNAQDTYFDTLFQKVHRFDIHDYKTYLNIPSAQARILRDALQSDAMHSMIDLQNLRGVGEKTFEKMYTFVNACKSKRIVTLAERQPALFDF